MAEFKARITYTDNSTKSLRIPAADEATALGIASALCDGEIEMLEVPSDITVSDPSATAVGCKLFTVTGKNNTTGSVTTVKFYGKISVSSTEVETAFIGKTINGVSIDEVFVSVSRFDI